MMTMIGLDLIPLNPLENSVDAMGSESETNYDVTNRIIAYESKSQ